MATLRIGTRGSALALAQSGQVGEAAVAGTGHEVALVHVRTTGDVDQRPLTQIGGTGIFVTAVRTALLDGEVDAVVHSLKDLPTAPPEGITVVAVPAREDPCDALIARGGLTLTELPRGARVGTGSPRRGAQLLRARPDLEVVEIRGNIDTRLARALGPEADLDAVVLAASGLRRADRGDVISEVLAPEVMLPAPAQGALAVECRTADVTDGAWFVDVLRRLDDDETRQAVTAERSLLSTLEAGCTAPVAAHATRTVPDGELTLRALAISPDASDLVESARTAATEQVDRARAMGDELARELIEGGAARIVAAAFGTSPSAEPPTANGDSPAVAGNPATAAADPPTATTDPPQERT